MELPHKTMLLLDWDEVHYVSTAYEDHLIKAINHGVFEALKQVNADITPEEAAALARDWYRNKPGTTMRGLLDAYPPEANALNQRMIETYTRIAHVATHDRFMADVVPNPEQGQRLIDMLEYTNIVIMTNSPRVHWEMQATHLYGEDFVEQFKGFVLPVDEMPRGICKPNPEAYRFMMQRYEFPYPERILFVDDSTRNLLGAGSLDIGVIKMRKPDEKAGTVAFDNFGSLQEFLEASQPFPEVLSFLKNAR